MSHSFLVLRQLPRPSETSKSSTWNPGGEEVTNGSQVEPSRENSPRYRPFPNRGSDRLPLPFHVMGRPTNERDASRAGESREQFEICSTQRSC